MKPTQVSSQLRKIAAAVDNSTRPDPRLVTKAIRKIVAAMAAFSLSERLANAVADLLNSGGKVDVLDIKVIVESPDGANVTVSVSSSDGIEFDLWSGPAAGIGDPAVVAEIQHGITSQFFEGG